MPTSLQIALGLVAVLLAIGGLSAAHHIRKRRAHGRDRDAAPAPPEGRPDL